MAPHQVQTTIAGEAPDCAKIILPEIELSQNAGTTPLLYRYTQALMQSGLGVQTRRAYQSRVRGFLSFVLDISGNDLHILAEAKHFEVLTNQYIEHLQSNRNNKSATVNITISALKHFGVFLGLQENAGRLTRIAAEPRRQPRTITADQVQKLLQASERFSTKETTIITLILTTGIRIGELRALNVEDVVLESLNGQITLRANSGQISRTVPLATNTRIALRRWLDTRSSLAVQGEEALFTNRFGRRFTTTGLDAIVRKVGHRAGLDICALVLRNSFLTELMAKVKDVSLVANLGGIKRVRQVAVVFTDQSGLV
jgi:site-specific recombinase XerD